MNTNPKSEYYSKSYYRKVREASQDQLRRKEARFKRQEKHRREVNRAFADFCEATDGEAYLYVNNGVCSFELAHKLAFDAWVKKTAARYYKVSGKKKPLNKLPRFKTILASLILSHFIVLDNTSPAMSHCALALLIKLIKKAEANIKHRALRPRYYEQENLRRKELAHQRRRIINRTTTNSCPDKEAILDAYMHRKDSKESAIHFGSLIHDLECYVDNDLKFECGRIVGRNTGIKGWLRDNIPVLESKYSTIMRYKAMAKKLRQLVELDDPIPAEAVLANEEELQNFGADENRSESTNNYTSENTDKRTNENPNKRTTGHINEYTNDCTGKCTNENPNKCTTECINEYTNDCTNESTDKRTNPSCNSLQNTDSNSMDNKNAITMRNKFALVENYRGESGELSNCRAVDGHEGRELPREGSNEGRELANDMTKSGDENENLHHNCDEVANGREIKYDALLSNKLTIEDRKRRIYQLLHAIAIYKEVVDGVNGVTQLMARVDAFLDPERIEEATTLAQWREKYKNEIILQNKFKWWKK